MTTLDGIVFPRGRLEVLSRIERDALATQRWAPDLFERFRRCSFAVLLAGTAENLVDEWWDFYKSYEIRLVPEQRGIHLHLHNAPSAAFVDGEIVEGTREHLYAIAQISFLPITRFI